MTNNDGWREVGGMTEAEWDRESVITGIFTERKENVGPNNSKLYVLDVNGTKTAVWGSTVLDTKFESVGLNEEVEITPLGKKTGKNGKEYSDYALRARTMPFHEVVTANDEKKN